MDMHSVKGRGPHLFHLPQRKVIFSEASVCPQGALPLKGGLPPGGSALRVSAQRGGLPPGGLPPHSSIDIYWQPLQRFVSILLECILFTYNERANEFKHQKLRITFMTDTVEINCSTTVIKLLFACSSNCVVLIDDRLTLPDSCQWHPLNHYVKLKSLIH